jgi:hypothetical protein
MKADTGCVYFMPIENSTYASPAGICEKRYRAPGGGLKRKRSRGKRYAYGGAYNVSQQHGFFGFAFGDLFAKNTPANVMPDRQASMFPSIASARSGRRKKAPFL